MSYDLDEAGDCYSRLGDYLCSDEIAMIRGDASSVYGDALARAWRDVIYLKPDVFIIYDDLLAHPVRAQRNYEWLLHSECPMSDVEGGIEARGERAWLFIQPVFPSGWEHKYVPGRTIAGADHKPLHCVSLRPCWHHKWNVSPRRSPYPHWDTRGDAEPLYSDDCQFLVVLSALRAEAQPRYEVQGLQEGTARGVSLRATEEQAVVLLNHPGGLLEVAGLRTDAEKAVVRCRPGAIHWALVRGTRLSWEDRLLFESQSPNSQTGCLRL
jgi:hypothetical protein